MPELVRIPAATAELVARFDRPYISLIGNRAEVIQAIASSLLPYNFKLANLEIIHGKPVEEACTFKIPELGITFQFGAESYRLVKDGASWSTAAEDGAIWNAAETALLSTSGAIVASCRVTLAVHLVPQFKTRDEVIAPFIAAPFKYLSGEPMTGFGSHIRFADGGEVLFDNSLGYANGIFLRFSAELDGKPPIPEIFARLRHDEKHIFKMLDVEEEMGPNE